jgi:TPR repeat protein
VDSAANSAVADAVKIQSYSAEQLRAQATKGDANAQFALGAKYASGEDVRQNYSEAVKWFTQAAEHGHVASAATLGAFYWAGRGVTQDYGSAYMWSTIARVGGDEASKYRVAILRARMNELEIAEAERRASAWLKDHSGQFAVKQDSGEKGTDTQP